MIRLTGIFYLVFFGILSVFNFVIDLFRYIGAAVRYAFFLIMMRKRSYHELYMESEVINNICGLGFLLALILAVTFAINGLSTNYGNVNAE